MRRAQVGDVTVFVPGGRRARRLEHQDPRAGIGVREVLDAARHGEHVAGSEHHGAVAHLDREATGKAQEELVRVAVRMPRVVALDLGDAHVVVVDARDDPGCPALVEAGESVVDVLRRVHAGDATRRRHPPPVGCGRSSVEPGRSPGSMRSERRWVVVLLGVASALTVAACGDDDDAAPADATAPPAGTAAAATDDGAASLPGSTWVLATASALDGKELAAVGTATLEFDADGTTAGRVDGLQPVHRLVHPVGERPDDHRRTDDAGRVRRARRRRSGSGDPRPPPGDRVLRARPAARARGRRRRAGAHVRPGPDDARGHVVDRHRREQRPRGRRRPRRPPSR